MKQFLLFALCAACATANTKLPPISSRNAPLESDERELWKQAADQEQRFEQRQVIYADPALDGYLDGVAARLAKASGCDDFQFRVQVLKSPYLNAFSLPNGFIYLTEGMLARLENEAQLAALLGHEMTHATHRHAARERRKLSNGAGFFGLDLLLPGIGTLAAYASASGYSRELETEADEVGFQRMAAAGYDTGEAPRIFEQLQQELAEEKGKEPFFFATHPALAARIENYRRLLKLSPPRAREKGAEVFAQHTAQLLLDAARLDFQDSRWLSAERSLHRAPKSARAVFLLGEVNRQRAQPDAALAQYREAIGLDEKFPPAYRAIGLLLLKRGEKPAARDALTKYLELSPAADDRAYVERDLEVLK